MLRRSLGSGRRLAVVGALVVLAGCLLPWYGIGGEEGELTRVTFRAFDGWGILSFISAILTLALVALPYAAGERPIAIDRGISYALLAVLSLAGVLLWVPGVLGAPEGLLPDRAVGFWIALVGSIILCRAAFEIATERPRR